MSTEPDQYDKLSDLTLRHVREIMDTVGPDWRNVTTSFLRSNTDGLLNEILESSTLRLTNAEWHFLLKAVRMMAFSYPEICQNLDAKLRKHYHSVTSSLATK